MRCTTVSSSALSEAGLRLNPRGYVDGSVQALQWIRRLPHERLDAVTSGFKGGIFTHLFSPKRTYVSSREHGVPFLGASSMLLADLSQLPLICNRDATSRSYRSLAIQHGMTLISCSGSVGRMAYARADMDGMVSAGDILKVQPDSALIPPGFLFSFLSSHLGQLLVKAGTYGSIVQHLEPEHIADLPVPRFDSAFELRVHALVEEAAALRAESGSTLLKAVTELEKLAGLRHLAPPPSPTPYSVTTAPASSVQVRLDGFFHGKYHQDALRGLASVSCAPLDEVSKRIVEPARFKRVSVSDPAYGVPFFGTTALFWLDPAPNYFLARSMRSIADYVVDERCVLIPRSGQLSGVIGSAVLPYGDIVGGAVSEDAIRVYFETEVDAGFGFVALTSEYGRRQLKARAFGSSIPHLDVRHIGQVRIPDLTGSRRRKLGEEGARVARMRHAACQLEREARALVEARVGGEH